MWLCDYYCDMYDSCDSHIWHHIKLFLWFKPTIYYIGYSGRLYFSDRISFNICDREKDTKLHAQVLDNMVLESSLSSSVTIVASDMSIKNNVTISIVYIHTFNKLLTKTIHHVVHITSTEAELFAIRCGINQSSSLNNVSKIIVITDTIHAVKKIFNPLVHLY